MRLRDHQPGAHLGEKEVQNKRSAMRHLKPGDKFLLCTPGIDSKLTDAWEVHMLS